MTIKSNWWYCIIIFFFFFLQEQKIFLFLYPSYHRKDIQSGIQSGKIHGWCLMIAEHGAPWRPIVFQLIHCNLMIAPSWQQFDMMHKSTCSKGIITSIIPKYRSQHEICNSSAQCLLILGINQWEALAQIPRKQTRHLNHLQELVEPILTVLQPCGQSISYIYMCHVPPLIPQVSNKHIDRCQGNHLNKLRPMGLREYSNNKKFWMPKFYKFLFHSSLFTNARQMFEVMSSYVEYCHMEQNGKGEWKGRMVFSRIKMYLVDCGGIWVEVTASRSMKCLATMS